MQALIAIPVFNERKHVTRVLERIQRFHRDILVVDDGSTDGTSRLLARRRDIQVIHRASNRGYGASIIDAFRFADHRGYDWVITMDCDEQHEPESIPDFIRAIEANRWDLVSGSRYLRPRAADDLPPGDRRAINATITEILNGLYDLKLTDAFCGFKAQRVSAVRRLDLDEQGYAFPMQLWPRAARANLRITEIPVRLIYNDPTRHFGGALDDARCRLEHYLSILQREVERPPAEEIAEPAPCWCE